MPPLALQAGNSLRLSEFDGTRIMATWQEAGAGTSRCDLIDRQAMLAVLRGWIKALESE